MATMKWPSILPSFLQSVPVLVNDPRSHGAFEAALPNQHASITSSSPSQSLWRDETARTTNTPISSIPPRYGTTEMTFDPLPLPKPEQNTD